ncbi:MAG: 3-hydroxybutyryl-CoA dehydrogenase [Pseudomonadota bacterium]
MAAAASINSIAVFGAGRMGCGIAEVCAMAGASVVVIDNDDAHLAAGLEAMGARLGRRVARGDLDGGLRDDILGRIRSSPSADDAGAAQLVIEAITEDEAAKRALLKDIAPRLHADAYLVTNTSSISITRLAAVSGRPERFLGMHFMNPAHRMQLVELIRGIATNDETFSVLKAFVERLGKTTAAAEDFPAFIVNRVLLPMVNEAIYALYEGVGTVEAIDSGLKLGANHPMGPLELADFIGLDVCLSIMHVLYDGLADSKYRPCPLLVKYVEAGWLGRKTGRGFYDYTQDPPRPTR